MLGIKSNRGPIKGEFALAIKDAVRRISTGNLNGEDKKIIKEANEVKSARQFVWK